MVDWVGTQDSLNKNVQLVGSWTVNVGDQDQALHLWRFVGGFQQIDAFNDLTETSSVSMIISYKKIKFLFHIM